MQAWGLYPWFAEHGQDLVHSEDRPLFASVHPFGHVFEKLREEGGYFILRYEGGDVRVRPSLFRPIPPLPFTYGDLVRVKPHRTVRIGTVRRIGWHVDRGKPMYYILAGERRIYSRYFAEELEKV